MTAKEYIGQISRLESHINAKKQRIEAMRCMATSVGPNYSGMPHNPSKSVSPMADAVCKIIDLEDEVRKDEYRLQEKRLFLLELIGQIECPDYQTILIKRYVEHFSWEDIARTLFFTKRWVFTLHGRALLELDNLLRNAPRIP